MLRALDEDAVRAALRALRAEGVRTLAVAFLWSVANPVHERRAAEIARDEIPDVRVICSVDVLPEIREWERTSAAVLSAYVLPAVEAYLRRLETFLAANGLRRPPLIMQVNGGVGTVDDVLRVPVTLLASGPAAGPAAASHTARGDAITIDMGGTSLDVAIVRAGRAAVSRELRVREQPIGVPGIEVLSIGAGGGSIASVDVGGALHVGPRSAGAAPGPACYGAGGTEPTVTDANLVLGYLPAERAARRTTRVRL